MNMLGRGQKDVLPGRRVPFGDCVARGAVAQHPREVAEDTNAADASRIDASVGGLGAGAGAGNTSVKVFVAVCERIGIDTGCDLFKRMDMAENAIFPLMDPIVRVDRSSRTFGFAGFYSTFLLHGQRNSERFGIPARDILVEPGRKNTVGGQENMIVDTAMTMAEERGLYQDAAAA